MVNVTLKMYNLQELIRKTYLDGLRRNCVILFKDNRMKVESIGTEEKDIVKVGLTSDINYPCETMTEGGEVAIEFLDAHGEKDFLPRLELFERDDIVSLVVSQNKLIITRTSPYQMMTYDLADKKFIKTYSEVFKTVFGKPIKLINNGKEKIVNFDAEVTIDAQKLKDHGSKLSKLKAEFIPISLKDGKLITNIVGTSEFAREVEGIVLANGNASSQFNPDILTVFKHGIGTATLRFSEGSLIHINFTHENMMADYLLQVHTEK